MKLRQGFITQEFRGEQLMVAVGEAAKRFHGLARSNATAAFIVNRLKTETTEAEIVSGLQEGDQIIIGDIDSLKDGAPVRLKLEEE